MHRGWILDAEGVTCLLQVLVERYVDDEGDDGRDRVEGEAGNDPVCGLGRAKATRLREGDAGERWRNEEGQGKARLSAICCIASISVRSSAAVRPGITPTE